MLIKDSVGNALPVKREPEQEVLESRQPEAFGVGVEYSREYSGTFLVRR